MTAIAQMSVEDLAGPKYGVYVQLGDEPKIHCLTMARVFHNIEQTKYEDTHQQLQ